MKVIKVIFGDWFENGGCLYEWNEWSEWNVVKEVVDEGIEMERERKEWDEKYDKESFKSGDYKGWRGFCKDMMIERVGEWIMDVGNESVSEFGWMMFNVEEFEKLEGKVIRIKRNESYGVDGWEIVEERDDMEMFLMYEVDMNIKDGDEIIVFDRGCEYFKLERYGKKWEEYNI